MRNFELAVGAGLIVLSLVSVGTCMARLQRGVELEGMQFVAVSNFFMGLFLITFALDRSDPVVGTVMLVSVCIGLGAGLLVLINTIRHARKDPFD
jgi:hypothetical protein